MNSDQFDSFARHRVSAASRRGIARVGTGVLGAVVLARAGLSSSEVEAVGSGRCRTPCGECEQCNKGSCRKTKSGTKRCKRGRCKPKPDFIGCSFGFCFAGACTPT